MPNPAGEQLSKVAVACPACGQDSHLLFNARDLNREASNGRFNYYICDACAVVHIFPIPSDLGKYYAKKDKLFSLPGSVEELRRRAQVFRPRLSIVQQFMSTGKLLDVGASYGPFVYLAQQNGFKVQAIEMDPDSCRFMNDNGIDAICVSSLDDAESLLGLFDVITLFHVIEHLDDVKGTLKVLARHLSPRGVLIITTPNPTSLQFRSLGRFWVNLDAPRHLLLLPHAALSAEAAQNELEQVWASSSDEEALAFSKWSWEASILNFLRSVRVMPSIESELRVREKATLPRAIVLCRTYVCRAIAVGLARLINIALVPLERSIDHGSSYSAVFRRKGNVAP